MLYIASRALMSYVSLHDVQLMMGIAIPVQSDNDARRLDSPAVGFDHTGQVRFRYLWVCINT